MMGGMGRLDVVVLMWFCASTLACVSGLVEPSYVERELGENAIIRDDMAIPERVANGQENPADIAIDGGAATLQARCGVLRSLEAAGIPSAEAALVLPDDVDALRKECAGSTRKPNDAQRHSLTAEKREKDTISQEKSAKARLRKDTITELMAAKASAKAEAGTKAAHQAAEKAVAEKKEKAVESKQKSAEEQTQKDHVTEEKAEKASAKAEAETKAARQAAEKAVAEKKEKAVESKQKNAEEQTQKDHVTEEKAAKASSAKAAEAETKAARQAAEKAVAEKKVKVVELKQKNTEEQTQKDHVTEEKAEKASAKAAEAETKAVRQAAEKAVAEKKEKAAETSTKETSTKEQTQKDTVTKEKADKAGLEAVEARKAEAEVGKKASEKANKKAVISAKEENGKQTIKAAKDTKAKAKASAKQTEETLTEKERQAKANVMDKEDAVTKAAKATEEAAAAAIKLMTTEAEEKATRAKANEEKQEKGLQQAYESEEKARSARKELMGKANEKIEKTQEQEQKQIVKIQAEAEKSKKEQGQKASQEYEADKEFLLKAAEKSKQTMVERERLAKTRTNKDKNSTEKMHKESTASESKSKQASLEADVKAEETAAAVTSAKASEASSKKVLASTAAAETKAKASEASSKKVLASTAAAETKAKASETSTKKASTQANTTNTANTTAELEARAKAEVAKASEASSKKASAQANTTNTTNTANTTAELKARAKAEVAEASKMVVATLAAETKANSVKSAAKAALLPACEVFVRTERAASESSNKAQPHQNLVEWCPSTTTPRGCPGAKMSLWDVKQLRQSGEVKEGCAWSCKCDTCFDCSVTDPDTGYTRSKVAMLMYFASSSSSEQLPAVQQKYLEMYQASLRDEKMENYMKDCDSTDGEKFRAARLKSKAQKRREQDNEAVKACLSQHVPTVSALVQIGLEDSAEALLELEDLGESLQFVDAHLRSRRDNKQRGDGPMEAQANRAKAGHLENKQQQLKEENVRAEGEYVSTGRNKAGERMKLIGEEQHITQTVQSSSRDCKQQAAKCKPMGSCNAVMGAVGCQCQTDQFKQLFTNKVVPDACRLTTVANDMASMTSEKGAKDNGYGLNSGENAKQALHEVCRQAQDHSGWNTWGGLGENGEKCAIKVLERVIAGAYAEGLEKESKKFRCEHHHSLEATQKQKLQDQEKADKTALEQKERNEKTELERESNHKKQIAVRQADYTIKKLKERIEKLPVESARKKKFLVHKHDEESGRMQREQEAAKEIVLKNQGKSREYQIKQEQIRDHHAKREVTQKSLRACSKDMIKNKVCAKDQHQGKPFQKIVSAFQCAQNMKATHGMLGEKKGWGKGTQNMKSSRLGMLGEKLGILRKGKKQEPTASHHHAPRASHHHAPRHSSSSTGSFKSSKCQDTSAIKAAWNQRHASLSNQDSAFHSSMQDRLTKQTAATRADQQQKTASRRATLAADTKTKSAQLLNDLTITKNEKDQKIGKERHGQEQLKSKLDEEEQKKQKALDHSLKNQREDSIKALEKKKSLDDDIKNQKEAKEKQAAKMACVKASLVSEVSDICTSMPSGHEPVLNPDSSFGQQFRNNVFWRLSCLPEVHSIDGMNVDFNFELMNEARSCGYQSEEVKPSGSDYVVIDVRFKANMDGQVSEVTCSIVASLTKRKAVTSSPLVVFGKAAVAVSRGCNGKHGGGGMPAGYFKLVMDIDSAVRKLLAEERFALAKTIVG